MIKFNELITDHKFINGKKVIQGIVRDIRDRRAAEQSRRETLDIIKKSPVAAFLWRNEKDWPVEFVTRM